MILCVRWLHQFAAQVIIQRRKSAGVRMTPGVTLDWSQALRSQLDRDGMHPYFRIDQDVRGIRKNCLTPAVDRERPLNKSIAHPGGQLGLSIVIDPSVIAEQLELPPVNLTKPAPDWNLPIGMSAKETADNP